MDSRPARRSALVALALGIAACGGATSSASIDTATATPPATTLPPSSAPAPPPTTSTTTTSTSTTSTSTSTTTTSTTTTSTTTTTTTSPPLPDPALAATNATFDELAATNPAVTLTVQRDGRRVLARASGTTIDGAAATSDSPMVVASVGKLVTALLVARLDQGGIVDLDAPTPWAVGGLDPHPAWNDVTLRELLAHTSGMVKVRREWFERSGDCASFLPTLLTEPPRPHRGEWTYSNGNYCALGLLVEGFTGMPLDLAAEVFLLQPLGASGIHLTTGGLLPTDVAYTLGVDRLARLGGAGSLVVSTDDLATLLSSLTDADRETLVWPGVFVDQYGWGHTGSVDGAVSCAWLLENARTVVVATVAGANPTTGGAVCDRIVPALATDLGLPVTGEPDRSPP